MAWGYYDGGYGGWGRYVSVAEKRANAEREAKRLAKKGRVLAPVELEGKKIAHTFWGKAWCENLEAYSDFANRLPRGRTYVRNGSVMDLQIAPGKVTALVMGSELYEIAIGISALGASAWKQVAGECTGQIDSLVELLSGKLSSGVMEVMTRKGAGLFPTPRQISMDCSCPDYASLCKHLAATLYGVGARLDEKPELLFVLRKVDHLDLIAQASTGAKLQKTPAAAKGNVLAASDLSGIFGIELDTGATPAATGGRRKKRKNRPATVTAKALAARGVSHSIMQNWIRAGVLVRTGERGVYGTTRDTESRVVAHLAKRSAR